MATPVFDGATEQEIKAMLKLAGLPESGQTTLYDGRTGESFDRPVTSLAARGDTLYAATWNADGRPRIAEVDPDTAEMTPLFDYEDLSVVFDGASFAENGTLWLLGRSIGGVPEFLSVGFYKIPDLTTGEITETFFDTFYFLDPEAGVLSLALAPRIDVVEVPTLGTWSLIGLAGLLGLLGLRRLSLRLSRGR